MTCFIWHFNKVLNFCCLLPANHPTNQPVSHLVAGTWKSEVSLGDLGTFFAYFCSRQFRVNRLQVLNKPNRQGEAAEPRKQDTYTRCPPWQQYNFSIMFECSGWSRAGKTPCSAQTVRSVSTFGPSSRSHWSGKRQTIWKTIPFTARPDWGWHMGLLLVKF